MSYKIKTISIATLSLLLCGCATETKTNTSTGNNAENNVKTASHDAQEWMAKYYLHPEPQKTTWAIKRLHDGGTFKMPTAQKPTGFFFGMVFRDNPAITTNILKECQFLSDDECLVFAYAFWIANTKEAVEQIKNLSAKNKELLKYLESDPPNILTAEFTNPTSLDCCWAGFMATGDTSYIDKVIDCLVYKNSKPEEGKTLLYGAARWSIVSNCMQDDKVLQHCKAVVEKRGRIVSEELKDILSQVADQAKKASLRDKSSIQTTEKIEIGKAQSKEQAKQKDQEPPQKWHEWNNLVISIIDGANIKKYTITITEMDMRVDSKGEPNGNGGSVVLTNGILFATTGIELEKGCELEALEVPLMHYSLVEKLLSTAFPEGTNSVEGKKTISFVEKEKELKIAIPSAMGLYGKPWRINGEASRTSNDTIAYHITFESSEPPDKPDYSKRIEFKGEWKHLANCPDFPGSLPLNGWRSFVIEKVKEQDASKVVIDFRAKELSNVQDLGALRSYSRNKE